MNQGKKIDNCTIYINKFIMQNCTFIKAFDSNVNKRTGLSKCMLKSYNKNDFVYKKTSRDKIYNHVTHKTMFNNMNTSYNIQN